LAQQQAFLTRSTTTLANIYYLGSWGWLLILFSLLYKNILIIAVLFTPAFI